MERIPGFSHERKRKRAAGYAQAFGNYYSKWLQLREALGDTSCVISRKHGCELLLRLSTTDILVLSSIYEREEYGTCLPFAPKVILDAGAYTGLSTVYFARKYPNATVIAIEPDKSNFDLLQRNTRAYSNIVLLNKALWYKKGPIILHDRGTGHWAFTLTPPKTEECRKGNQVETVTIDELMALFDIDFIDALKIDIEGAEKEVFECSGPWIHRVKAIFAELHESLRPGCTAAFEAATTSFTLKKQTAMTVCCLNNSLLKEAASENRKSES